jgi:hypothetical protein
MLGKKKTIIGGFDGMGQVFGRCFKHFNFNKHFKKSYTYICEFMKILKEKNK